MSCISRVVMKLGPEGEERKKKNEKIFCDNEIYFVYEFWRASLNPAQPSPRHTHSLSLFKCPQAKYVLGSRKNKVTCHGFQKGCRNVAMCKSKE